MLFRLSRQYWPFAVFLGLLALRTAQTAGWIDEPRMARLLTTLSDRNMNTEAREALTAGYYEGLINEGSRVSSMNRLLTDNRRLSFENRKAADRRQVSGFLYYELAPNMDEPDYDDQRQRYRLKTNSFGLADREYSLEKPPGTRRLALLGDSVSRGQGAPFLGNYESLLENTLNQSHTNAGTRRFEILNFAVGSYNITQSMDVALEKVPPFDADVYVVGLTHLSVYRRWGQHIALLMHGGIDLKYDYLRQVARDAGLDPREPIGVFDAKLARFRLPTVRWALEQIKRHAEERGAQVLVLLVPIVDKSGAVQESFLGVREMLTELDLVWIDLLDSFQSLDDLAAYRVSAVDSHPNAEGHRLLYERLYEKLRTNPQAWQIVTGQPSTEPRP
jgi:hypothetical protein